MAARSTGGRARNTEAAPVQIPDAGKAQAAGTVQKTEATTQQDSAVRQTFTPKAFNPNQIVTVRNGFQGRLVYQSRKTGERFVWDEFGSEQDMELAELKSARNSNKKYFINNWWMFDDPEIIEYLGMTQYYKFALCIGDFDRLFDEEAAVIADKISRLSSGQKKSVAYRAKQLIAQGAIDSNRKIACLEECLGIDLIER